MNSYSSPWVQRLFGWRPVRFGSVGASGVLVNLAVLYLGREYLFAWLGDPLRLNLALALAIFLATLNNFTWNRLWTWQDRRPHIRRSLWVQLGQYFLAGWLGIGIQVALTNALALWLHYLLANLLAIACAAVANYLVNDVWTFRSSLGPADEGTS